MSRAKKSALVVDIVSIRLPQMIPVRVVEMVPLRVVEMVPAAVVEMVPAAVVEIVPAAVVEMVPALVVEMVPPLENAVAARARVRIVAQKKDLKFFMSSPGVETSGAGSARRSDACEALSFGSTFYK